MLYLGDVREQLRRLPTRSVHCVVTSPPYWGLRKYLEDNHSDKHHELGAESTSDCLGWATGARCEECYVCHLVEVFAEVRRVLRDDGTVWLNLGDTFNNGQGMIPAAVAMALRADGWKLVQDIIWHSPNKMPESVTNRCTKSHEHIFLLAKGNDYYYDAVAIAEPAKSKPHAPGNRKLTSDNGSSLRNDINELCSDKVWGISGYANKRDVWIVSTTNYPGAHFAVYSPKLITPCILAGTSEYGCCAICGKPYERIVAKERVFPRIDGGGHMMGKQSQDTNGTGAQAPTEYHQVVSTQTVGWRKMCGCQTTEVQPCVIFDPFVGSGTTVSTALELGRAGIGIDLNETYLQENAIPRIEATMRGERVGKKLAPVVAPDVPPPPKPLW
jgi:DNA modification methylase